MAKYEAIQSFGGIVSMYVGEVKDLTDDNIVKDLLSAGYIKEICPTDKGEAKATEKKKGAKA